MFTRKLARKFIYCPEDNYQPEKSIDVVYKDQNGGRRFCLELKHSGVQDLDCGKQFGAEGMENDAALELSGSIAGMKEEEVLSLQLKPKHEFPEWFQSGHQQLENAWQRSKSELQINTKPNSKKMMPQWEELWVLVRVGRTILNQRVFDVYVTQFQYLFLYYVIISEVKL
jgi:hypothetical protein